MNIEKYGIFEKKEKNLTFNLQKKSTFLLIYLIQHAKTKKKHNLFAETKLINF